MGSNIIVLSIGIMSSLMYQKAASVPVPIAMTTCEEPHRETLHQAWVDHHGNVTPHPSWYLLSDMQNSLSGHLNKSSSVSTIHVSGSRSVDCSVPPTNALGSPLQERSLCPWYNVINHDPARYPSDLVEARCSCSTCAGLDDSSAVCEPIHYNAPVMRKTPNCSNGTLEWEQGWQKLVVGCSCGIRPQSII